jgi:hypothetical protein
VTYKIDVPVKSTDGRNMAVVIMSEPSGSDGCSYRGVIGTSPAYNITNSGYFYTPSDKWAFADKTSGALVGVYHLPVGTSTVSLEFSPPGASCLPADLFFVPVPLSTPVTLSIPARPAGARTGTQFYGYSSSMALTDRENAIFTEVTSGNIPDFQRTMVEVAITTTISGQSHTFSYYVIPDYLAIGCDTDYFLMPMSPLMAQKIADRLGCNLPTRKMVNDIWYHASVKMTPSPISPSALMITIPVFWDHNTTLRVQRAAFFPGNPLGSLVSGDKKDVVVTKLLATTPGKVAIYGWHYTTGSPIQPLYLGHEDTYADYSHGIRLVRMAMTLDGSSTTIANVLQDPVLNPLLSDEGAVTSYRYSVPLPVTFPLRDSFPSTGRQLDSWTNKFTVPVITSFSPSSPGGDGYVLVVHDTTGGMETTRTGNVTDTDYFVQTDIYCRYRPELSTDGYERCGIFTRDNGNGSFEHTTGGGGYCYLMAWDSNNGRLWCGRSINGSLTDLNTTAIYYPTTQWRTMRIDARGSQLTFKLNGTQVLTVSDTTYSQGQCGIGFHEYFTTNSNMLGTYADNFYADAITSSIQTWESY